MSDKPIAIHEASHAVIWFLHGYGIESVTIRPTPDQQKLGIRGRTEHGDFGGPDSPGNCIHTASYIIGALAGGTGEQKFTGVRSAGLVSDFELINKQMAGVDEAHVARILAGSFDRLDYLLNQEDVWGAIVEVSDRLLERDVSGEEVRQLVTERCPTKLW